MNRTIEFKGATCSYAVKGKGHAVMLIHGFMEEGSMWDAVSKKLSAEFKVIAPDLPGFGQSPMVNGQWSMELYAEFLKTICEKEKIKSVILLGHSMGGYITLSFAEKYPEMLSGFGLINSHCYEDSAEKKANRKKSIAFIFKNGTKYFLHELYNNIFEDSYKMKQANQIAPMIEKALKYKPEAVIAATEAMMKRKDKSQVLRDAKVPVLLIGGKQDKIVPPELFLKQASLPNIADFHLFDNSSHMTVFEKENKSLKAIEEFCGR